MSSSEEKTPTVSPDQGATGETTTSSENKKAGTQTGLSEEEEACYKEEYRNDVIKLLKNISRQDPELGRDIVMEAICRSRQDKEKWLNKLGSNLCILAVCNFDHL